MSPLPSSKPIRRHGLLARLIHCVNAGIMLVILFTGTAVGGFVPKMLIWALGGHGLLNAVHQQLGLAFVALWVVLAAVLAPRMIRLLRDVLHARRGDGRWFVGFAGHLAGRSSAPWHNGRFDPAQRLVFAGLILGLLGAAISGVSLYFLPMGRLHLFIGMMWGHVISAWLLLACIGVHVVAGLGVLPTHRGIVRSMFGDGRVSRRLARTLWPGWAKRQ